MQNSTRGAPNAFYYLVIYINTVAVVVVPVQTVQNFLTLPYKVPKAACLSAFFLDKMQKNRFIKGKRGANAACA